MNLVENRAQELFRQVGVVIDAAVVLDKLGLCHALLDLAVVLVHVEHDARVRKHIGRVGVGKNVGVVLDVALGKLEHEAVNLLGLAGQPERLQKVAAKAMCKCKDGEYEKAYRRASKNVICAKCMLSTNECMI